VLAVPDLTGALTYAGGVGTGFTARMLADLHRRLTPLHRPTPAAAAPRDHRRGVVWVEPVFVGEIEHRNRTPDGRYRHPSWRGLRPDRSVDDIGRTTPNRTARPTGAPARVQIPAGNGPHYAKFDDVEMLVVAGGADRNEGEYTRLLAAGGFAVHRVTPLR
jgi:hypothetical protein